VFLLVFLVIVVGGSLLLYAARAAGAGPGGTFEAISRESLLLTNNVLLTAAAGAVLLGTLYPLFVDALSDTKLSVGPPYFNTVFVAIMAPAMFLLGVGPVARWKHARLPDLAVRLRWAFAVSVCVCLALPLTLGGWRPLVSLGVLLALWIVTTTTVNLWGTVTAGGRRRLLSALKSASLGYYGMHVAHIGVAVSIVGVTIVTGYQTERDLRMNVGDQATIAGYTFTLRGVTDVHGPNYLAARANVDVFSRGKPLRTMHPERRLYSASATLMTESAIDMGPFRHLYVSLGEPLDGTSWRIQIQHKPFVGWIWAGAFLMATGGGLAAVDRRYVRSTRVQRRRKRDSSARLAPAAASGARL
jgi:cytochrome c-type biogenesis protein CcmF